MKFVLEVDLDAPKMPVEKDLLTVLLIQMVDAFADVDFEHNSHDVRGSVTDTPYIFEMLAREDKPRENRRVCARMEVVADEFNREGKLAEDKVKHSGRHKVANAYYPRPNETKQ